MEFVLNVRAPFIGAKIAVRIALQDVGGRIFIRRIGCDKALQELRKIHGANHASAGSLVTRVELGVGIRATKRNRVFTVAPGGAGRGHEAILENPSVGALRLPSLPDRQGRRVHIVCIRPQHVHDGHARKEIGAESVDGGLGRRCAGG